MRLVSTARLTAALLMVALLGLGARAGHAQEPLRRLHRAGVVFGQIMAAPDGGVPDEILRHSQCVMVIPGLKRAGFVFGGSFGRGVVSCRTGHGWSAPLFVTVGGGSFGLQIGAQETDLVLLIMNRSGERYLLRDKFTLGGEMAASAGPVGRNAAAQTDALLHAKMLAYSRSRGLFGGITLDGATILQDHDANKWLYRRASARQILHGGVRAPAQAGLLLRELNRRGR